MKKLLILIIILFMSSFLIGQAYYTPSNLPELIDKDSIYFKHFYPPELNVLDRLIQPQDWQISHWQNFEWSNIITIHDTTIRDVGIKNLNDSWHFKFNGDSITIETKVYMNLAEIDTFLSNPKLSTTYQSDSLDVASVGYVDSSIAAIPISSISADTLVNQNVNTGAVGDLLCVTGVFWQQATNTDVDFSKYLLGIYVSDALANDKILIRGIYITTGLSTGDIYYIGASGAITNTQPSTTGDIVRIIGYAISSTQLWFDPSKEWMEVL